VKQYVAAVRVILGSSDSSVDADELFIRSKFRLDQADVLDGIVGSAEQTISVKVWKCRGQKCKRPLDLAEASPVHTDAFPDEDHVTTLSHRNSEGALFPLPVNMDEDGGIGKVKRFDQLREVIGLIVNQYQVRRLPPRHRSTAHW